MGTEESKKIWEKNAQFWDNAMGDKSNEFHREVVRPKVTELLASTLASTASLSAWPIVAWRRIRASWCKIGRAHV